MNKELMKVRDVAPLLGVTANRVYQLIAAGVILAVRIGGAIRIPLHSWEGWLQMQNQRATENTREARSLAAERSAESRARQP